MEVWLGLPTFLYNTMPFYAPSGQEYAHYKIRRRGGRDRLANRLFKEYMSVVAAADLHLDLPCGVALAHKRIIDPNDLNWLFHKLKVGYITLPRLLPVQHLNFVRDMAVSLPNGNVLLNNSIARGRFTKKDSARTGIIPSPFGEGGRLLFVPGSNAVLTSNFFIYVDRKQQLRVGKAPYEHLLDGGFRVGLLPDPVGFSRTPGNRVEVMPEPHLDRIGGMLRDPRGGLHLVVFGGGFHSGFNGHDSPPANSPEQTIEEYRRVCDLMEITLHVVPKATVPLSTGFVQFSNGKVIMTRGDKLVFEVVASIVGRENIIQTILNFSYYPAWVVAGIRCLINELPRWFRERIETPSEKFWGKRGVPTPRGVI